jgi:alditol oxidase
MAEKQKNWAGNYEFSTTNLHHPTSIEEIQALMKNSRKVKVLGTRHSFNHIADSDDVHISLNHFNNVVALDTERCTVTVEAGMRYGELGVYLNAQGFAIHNMASLPHITIIGAVSTATHGSGAKNGSLATAVSGLEFVTGNGDIVTLSREIDGEQFNGAVVGLGGIGVVTKITLDIMPRFDMQQYVYLNLPAAQMVENWDAILASAYSVSIFTDWQTENHNQIWLKMLVTDDTPIEEKPEFFGAARATKRYHPIGEMAADNCTEQMGIRGSWHERLSHFTMDAIANEGNDLQAEYFVSRQNALEAFKVMSELRATLAPVIAISEIRMIAADDLWMSPYYKQDSVAIHFSWQRDLPGVLQVLPIIEERLAPFAPRPHWGKLFTMPAKDIQSRYEKLADFRQLLQHYDPQGKFRNAFLDEYIFGD